jgi:hypothetical protein
MHLDLDAAYLGEGEPGAFQGETCLGIGEAGIAVAALKAGITGGFPGFAAPEKGLIRPFYPQEHILQHLGMHFRVFGQFLLDGGEGGLLLVVGDGNAAHAPGFFPFRNCRVVEFSAPGQGLGEGLFLFACWIQAVRKGFPHGGEPFLPDQRQSQLLAL